MPQYEYKCMKGHIFAEIRSVENRNHETKCPKCDKPSKKTISRSSFALKGNWFATTGKY